MCTSAIEAMRLLRWKPDVVGFPAGILGNYGKLEVTGG